MACFCSIIKTAGYTDDDRALAVATYDGNCGDCVENLGIFLAIVDDFIEAAKKIHVVKNEEMLNFICAHTTTKVARGMEKAGDSKINLAEFMSQGGSDEKKEQKDEENKPEASEPLAEIQPAPSEDKGGEYDKGE